MTTFYHLLANNIISSVTNFTVWFAITFFLFLETRSVFATAILSGIWLVATAGSGFWLGSLVDHYKKKDVMIVSSVISLISFILSFIIYILVPSDTFKMVSNPLLWVFVLILMTGVIAGNLRTIALPTIVTMLFPPDKRDKANGLSGTAFGIAFLITSVISGFLVGHSGMYLVLILAIITTILAILHMWTINIKEQGVVHTQDGQSQKVDIKGTLKVVLGIPGLLALILFTTFNNFLGGVFMSLLDTYGLQLVSVQVWGLIWGFLSTGFIVGGLVIAKFGLGKNPLLALFSANIAIWTICIFFTIQPWIALTVAGMYVYLIVMPYIEASEHTILQNVVPPERQGRVFGFAQSVEQSASPLTAFMIGPIAQFIFIPYMSEGGQGANLIGSWFGVGPDRGIALVFTITGIIGLTMTILAMNSKYYKLLSNRYLAGK